MQGVEHRPVGDGEREADHGDGFADEKVDLRLPAVVVFPRRHPPHVEAVALGFRLDELGVAAEFGTVDRHRVRDEQVDPEEPRTGARGPDLLGEHLGRLVAGGQESEASGRGGGDDQRRRARPSRHWSGQHRVGHVESGERSCGHGNILPIRAANDLPCAVNADLSGRWKNEWSIS